MEEGYFSIKRDMAIVRAGGFFCQGCLVGKPMDDKSPDLRYCLSCYEFLTEEYRVKELMSPGRAKPRWAPVLSATTAQQEQREVIAKPSTKGIVPLSEKKEVIMQHPGRPRKKGKVHRITSWRRRKKELQGVLV